MTIKFKVVSGNQTQWYRFVQPYKNRYGAFTANSPSNHWYRSVKMLQGTDIFIIMCDMCCHFL